MMMTLMAIQTGMVAISTGVTVYYLGRKGARYLSLQLINKHKNGFKHYKAVSRKGV